ncbi:Transcription factor IIIB 60 kDa subunit [Hyphodiscus hymeniophilus]|uniref:B-related factor 1 n=1 Tax=Hyphodiscus hymeniophilus TaxID=353542 RepID=A0A9P6VLY9_9HELO|nr:Transcription factor IIIB 60 kDa subunit [Hyphodiscus hymeniophilus]
MAPQPKNTKSAARAPNPIRNQREIRGPASLRKPTGNTSRPAKRACPNVECNAPNINEEGTCTNCGTIVNDSNIVSEVSFGETSNGQAVLQGSYVGENQGAARSMGPGFRAGGIATVGESRLATQREGKQHMDGFATQFDIRDSIVTQGLQLFKLAADRNFIQGRRIDMVAAVCLYTACRSEKPCNVMLIDFADRLQVNVFKLGHTFKVLHRTVTIGAGIVPMLPEDLMYRFALKLEFGDKTSEVADAAIRLSRRMNQDWMVVGRRPSGVCGACLILAARMFNFRRTVTEVVYIVKVTTATIQKRMEEFKLTASANLTVDEFLHTEFLESAHDPPSFYQKQEEFIKNKKTRKRKRQGQLLEEGDEVGSQGDEAGSNKRQKTATPSPDEALPTVEARFDADGFAIPAQPVPTQPPSVTQPQSKFDDLVDETAENPTNESLAKLVQQFGDAETPDDEDDGDNVSSPASTSISVPKRGRPRAPKDSDFIIPPAWAEDEERIQKDILDLISDPKLSQLVFDPNTKHHAALFSIAEKRSRRHIADFEKANPRKEISDSQTILEDEFANDPEVQNCLLSAADIEKKEKVWVNENKTWLRKQQIKEYNKRLAENGPPKRTRNRKKAVRIGEFQTSPASSAGEAAISVMQKRALSKKINYANITSIFEDMDGPGGGALGSAATSRVTSRAGSSVPESPFAINDQDSDLDEHSPQDESSTSKATHAPGTSGTRSSPPAKVDPDIGSDDGDDDDDYVRPDDQPVRQVRQSQQDPEEEDSWKIGNRNRGVDEVEDEGFPDGDEDDFGEDIGDTAFNDLDEQRSDDGYDMEDDD